MARAFWLLLLISSAAIADTRNVLLIIADDQGLDIGAYGNHVLQTPSLDQLFARGLQTLANTSKLLPLIALFTFVSPAHAAGACSKAPTSMRAARIHAAGGPEALHYVSINPVDWKLQERGRLPFPAIPGGDFSGEVIALGSGVTDFACGELVAGSVDQAERSGSYAEYLAVPTTEIVRKPAAFTMAGERVLVQGGAGGTGWTPSRRRRNTTAAAGLAAKWSSTWAFQLNGASSDVGGTENHLGPLSVM